MAAIPEPWPRTPTRSSRNRIRDAALLAAIRDFAGQEGQHARHHARYVDVLEAQG